jgi:hypothetical protein
MSEKRRTSRVDSECSVKVMFIPRSHAGAAMLLAMLLFPLSAGIAQLKMTVGTPNTSEFPVIHLSVHVQDSSGNYTNLLPSNFMLKENGTQMLPLQLDCLTKDNAPPINFCFLMDCSESMNFYEDGTTKTDPNHIKWKTAKADVILAFNSLRPQDSAALVTFSWILNHWNFTTDKSALSTVVGGLFTNSGTRIYDALFTADSMLRTRSPRRIAILLTDGSDNGSSKSNRMNVLKTLMKDSVVVYTIGLGIYDNKASTALRNIADSTHGKYYLAPTSAELAAFIKDIIESIFLSDCVLTYTAPDTCRSGGTRQIEVSVSVNGKTATASTQYTDPDFRSRVSMSMPVPPTFTVPDHLEFPLLLNGELRSNEATNAVIVVGYNPSLMAFAQFRPNPSLFNPDPAATETTKGFIRIQATASVAMKGIPYGSTDTLGWLSFDFIKVERSTASQITVDIQSFSQYCFTVSTGSTMNFSVHSCPSQLKVDVGYPRVVESGTRFWLPLRLVYPLDMQQSLRYSFQFNYDTTFIRYVAFTKENTISENLDVQVSEPMTGALQINAPEGMPKDTSGALLLLGFESARQKETHVIPLSFLNPTLVQPCLPPVQFDDAVIALDGVCTPLVVKKSAFTLQQNHPNPVSSTTSPVTTIEFSVSGAGHTTLDVFDFCGRRVATLVDAELETGAHTVSFSPSAFPKGMYTYVLRQGSNVAVRKLIWLQ